ncbi:MAG: putative nucleotide-diphospho-sugar transferase [Candidatus Dependentiae bacterium]|nr:putative nucleotide-diphospho-sugar transferase [Candidatus Dependentiae bacterium]
MNHVMRNSFFKVLIMSAAVSMVSAQDKINLYSFYTPSHQIFKDKWFVATLKDEGLNVTINEYPQECATGKVFSAGWKHAMLRKVDMIIEAIESNWGTVFVYADIDIQFFKPISKLVVELIGDKDLVIQRDTPSGTVCAGFFACRGNQRTLSLWQGIRNYMIENNECSDQKTLNRLLRKGVGKENNRYKVVWDYLPADFLGGGTFTGSGWSPKKQLFVPSGIVLHHANWAIGNELKLAQLEYVRKKVQKRKP